MLPVKAAWLGDLDVADVHRGGSAAPVGDDDREAVVVGARRVVREQTRRTVGGVGEDTAGSDGHGAVLRLRDRVGERVIVYVNDIQIARDHARVVGGVDGRCPRSGGRVVDGGDGDRHGGGVAGEGAVGDGVGEGVGAGEVAPWGCR